MNVDGKQAVKLALKDIETNIRAAAKNRAAYAPYYAHDYSKIDDILLSYSIEDQIKILSEGSQEFVKNTLGCNSKVKEGYAHSFGFIATYVKHSLVKKYGPESITMNGIRGYKNKPEIIEEARFLTKAVCKMLIDRP
jgi:hypothetical protein